MNIRNETKVGFLAVISVSVLIVGLNFLKGKNIFSRSRQFYAVFERVNGLTEGNPVLLSGYKVGHVTKLELSDKNQKQIIATLTIAKDFEVPSNSRARIESTDLLGSKVISLYLGNQEPLLGNGDTILSEVEDDVTTAFKKEIQPIKEKTEVLLGQIDSFLLSVQSILSDENKRNLSQSLQNLNSTLNDLSQTAQKIGNAVEQSKIDSLVLMIKTILSVVDKNSPKINDIIVNSSALTDTLVRTLKIINQNLQHAENILGKVNEGKGSLGKFVMDESVYYRLNRSLSLLDSLLSDIKTNPERYVNVSIFGGRKK